MGERQNLGDKMRRQKLESRTRLAREIGGCDRPVLQGKGDMAADSLMCDGKSILCKQYLRELEHPSGCKIQRPSGQWACKR